MSTQGDKIEGVITADQGRSRQIIENDGEQRRWRNLDKYIQQVRSTQEWQQSFVNSNET